MLGRQSYNAFKIKFKSEEGSGELVPDVKNGEEETDSSEQGQEKLYKIEGEGFKESASRFYAGMLEKIDQRSDLKEEDRDRIVKEVAKTLNMITNVGFVMTKSQDEPEIWKQIGLRMVTNVEHSTTKKLTEHDKEMIYEIIEQVIDGYAPEKKEEEKTGLDKEIYDFIVESGDFIDAFEEKTTAILDDKKITNGRREEVREMAKLVFETWNSLCDRYFDKAKNERSQEVLDGLKNCRQEAEKYLAEIATWEPIASTEELAASADPEPQAAPEKTPEDKKSPYYISAMKELAYHVKRLINNRILKGDRGLKFEKESKGDEYFAEKIIAANGKGAEVFQFLLDQKKQKPDENIILSREQEDVLLEELNGMMHEYKDSNERVKVETSKKTTSKKEKKEKAEKPNEQAEKEQERLVRELREKFEKAAGKIMDVSRKDFEENYAQRVIPGKNFEGDYREKLRAYSTLIPEFLFGAVDAHSDQDIKNWQDLNKAVEGLLDENSDRILVVVDGVDGKETYAVKKVVESNAAGKQEQEKIIAGIPEKVANVFANFAKKSLEFYEAELGGKNGQAGYLDKYKDPEDRMQFLWLLIKPIVQERIEEKKQALIEKYGYSSNNENDLMEYILQSIRK